MTKHTPGPWLLAGDDGKSDATAYARTPVNQNPLYIARVYGEGVLASSSPGTEERKANARLIAAAPDLLAACKAALSLVESLPYDPTDRQTLRINDQIADAIAKAEGR